MQLNLPDLSEKGKLFDFSRSAPSVIEEKILHSKWKYHFAQQSIVWYLIRYYAAKVSTGGLPGVSAQVDQPGDPLLIDLNKRVEDGVSVLLFSDTVAVFFAVEESGGHPVL